MVSFAILAWLINIQLSAECEKVGGKGETGRGERPKLLTDADGLGK